jgi:hypothetical protein
MPKVVISYRRADSDAIAGRIRDRLAHYFGEESIFMDVDSIPFGTDFRDYVRDALFDSDVLVAVVGPKWLGPAEGAHLRIKEENDPIRIEVETALNRGISVIPVLVNGGVMPKPSELPVALENFAFRNAAEVDSGRDFHPHMDRLIRSIEQILRLKGQQVSGRAVGSPAAAGEPSSAQAAPVVPTRPPEAPPAPAQPAYAAAPVGPANVSAPAATAPPVAKPKRGGAVIALSAAGGAAIAAALAYIAIEFYGKSAPPIDPEPPVIAQPKPPVVTRPPSGPPILAGCPGTPAFRDDFKTVDPGWDLGKNAYHVDGQLAVKAPADTALAVLYPSLVYKNANICLDVKTPPAMNSPNYGGGLLFWSTGYANYYRILLTVDGRYQIARRVDGNVRIITPFTKFDGLKQGYGVVNRIKVTTAGNVAAIYFNDRKVLDLKGQPPRSGGSVGVYGGSEKDQANEWRFVDIAVVERPPSETIAVPPPEAAVKAMLTECKLAPDALFADDFKVPNPSWNGLEDDEVYYANGRLVIKAQENKVGRVLNLGLIYKDISICADLTSPAQMKAENDTAGGIIFWASGFTNNYYARIYPDGSYSINRIVDSSYLTVAPKTEAHAVNKGPGAPNRLKVVLNGNVGTLYINDVKIREFRGQPPPDGSSIGLYADSEAKNRAEWQFSGIVVTGP